MSPSSFTPALPTEWERVRAAATSLAAAGAWRSALAEALLATTGTRFCAVFTCAPARSLEAAWSVAPAGYEALVARVVDEFLPRIERGGDSARGVARWPKVTAPLDDAADRALAERLRRTVYGPAGIDGLLVAPMCLKNKDFVGWMAVGAEVPAAALRAAVGEPLAAAARLAAGTLETAHALASAIGTASLPRYPAGLELLSRREREVSRAVADGCSDAEVATRLHISEQTVGTHLKRVYEKLGVHSRLELVARVTGHGGR